MLYELVQFSDQIGPLNVFRYISFRAVGATVTALLIVFVFGPMMIDILRVRQGKGQPIREDGPKSHLSKRGTPRVVSLTGYNTIARRSGWPSNANHSSHGIQPVSSSGGIAWINGPPVSAYETDQR